MRGQPTKQNRFRGRNVTRSGENMRGDMASEVTMDISHDMLPQTRHYPLVVWQGKSAAGNY